MNKKRIKKIEAIRDMLLEIEEEETLYRDNIPENLINSKRYEDSDCASDCLCEAISQLDEILENIS